MTLAIVVAGVLTLATPSLTLAREEKRQAHPRTTFVADGASASGRKGKGNHPPLTPIPEPTTLVAGALLVGLLGWRERRRIGALFLKDSDKSL